MPSAFRSFRAPMFWPSHHSLMNSGSCGALLRGGQASPQGTEHACAILERLHYCVICPNRIGPHVRPLRAFCAALIGNASQS